MKIAITKNTTSFTTFLNINDTVAGLTGTGLTGITAGSAGLLAYYVRSGDLASGGANNPSAAVAITLTGVGVTSTYASGGFVAVDNTNMPGVYRFDIPNAVFSSGTDTAWITMQGAARMVPVHMEFQFKEVPSNLTQVNGSSATGSGTVDANLVSIQATSATLTAGIISVNVIQALGVGVSASSGVFNVVTGVTGTVNANVIQALGVGVSATNGVFNVVTGVTGTVNANVIQILGSGVSSNAGIQNVNTVQFGGSGASSSNGVLNVSATVSGTVNANTLNFPATMTANVTQINGQTSVDGSITPLSLSQTLLSVLAGKSTAITGATSTQISFYKQDGSTIKLTVTGDNTQGTRANTGSIF